MSSWEIYLSDDEFQKSDDENIGNEVNSCSCCCCCQTQSEIVDKICGGADVKKSKPNEK